MYKNLMLLHLESLNTTFYKIHRELFPFISNLEKRCIVFDNYFSTATSTLMVLGDLVYGGMEQYEQCNSLDYIPSYYPYSVSLFDELKEKGYKTGIYIFPNGGDRESAEKRHLIGFNNEMILKKDYSEFLGALEQDMEKEPFALMACNYISNLSFNEFVPSCVSGSGYDNWKRGYEFLDSSIKDIFELLERKRVLDSTLVVLYGDHGEDYWTHGLHGGLTHGIEPLAGMIHTPLFVFDNSLCTECRIESLINTTDMKELIGVGLEDIENLINYTDVREYSVARNEYAAQPLRIESFNKSYSVTDGEFLLCVSNAGMELYNIYQDYSCHNNLLKFFVMQGDLITFDKAKEEELRFHLYAFFNSEQIRLIRQKFYYLKSHLYEEVKKLYLTGNCTEERLHKEMRFDCINYS